MIKMAEPCTSSKTSSQDVFLDMTETFSDVTIVVNGDRFRAHKITLCQCSPYFEALFIRWSDHEKVVFDITDLTACVMRLIIEFAYTKNVSVTEDNILDLFLAADMLNMTGITQICCNFLEEHFNPDNCIGIWQFTNIYFAPDLQRKAFNYITNNFVKCVSSGEFQQLSVQELTDILGSDYLNVMEEYTVYEAIRQWISHAPADREKRFAVLMSKVRLALSSEEFISTVMSSEMVMSNPECQEVVKQALQLKHHMTSTLPHSIGCWNLAARPRLPNAILLAVGGWSEHRSKNYIEAYDVRTDRWICVGNNRVDPYVYHGIAFLNGFVYRIGGYANQSTNIVRRFDLLTRTWHEAAPMYRCRCFLSVAVLDGSIYAIGGSNGQKPISNVERYIPEKNQWYFTACMNESRSRSGCTTYKNKIYVCGGFNGNQHLNNCEYYNPETNQWTLFNSMSNRRGEVGVAAYADQIFAVGGVDGTSHLDSVEAFNPHTLTWHAVSTMLTPRTNFGIHVLENKLFVAGGFIDGLATNKVEYYDADTDEWSEACKMKILQGAMACCVLTGLPNLAEYAICRETLPFIDLEESLIE